MIALSVMAVVLVALLGAHVLRRRHAASPPATVVRLSSPPPTPRGRLERHGARSPRDIPRPVQRIEQLEGRRRDGSADYERDCQ